MSSDSEAKSNGAAVKPGVASTAPAAAPTPVAAPAAGSGKSSALASHRPSTSEAGPNGAVPPASLWASVVAGTGEKGYSSGPGLEARFNTPMAVAIDTDGMLYVSDMGNQRICRITPSGVVATLAGGIQRQAAAGSDSAATYNVDEEKVMFRDGMGPDARFNQPLLACFDKQHNMFVADHYNHRIRHITPTGQVSTFAGSVGGDHDGKRTGAGGALFDHPVGVVFDSAGNLFVADQMNHKIKKIAPDGTVSTFAGHHSTDTDDGHGNVDGTGTSARFNQPGALAIDEHNNLYVSDARNNSIRKITPSAVVTTLAGGKANPQSEHAGCDDGAAEIATFYTPAGLALDKAGNVYVADAVNHRIRKIAAADCMVSTYLGGGPAGMKNGTFADGDGTHARFNGPMSVAIDPKSEYIYVADAFNHRIRRFPLSADRFGCRACTTSDCTLM